MKKDRNCGMNVYPNMMPVIMPGQMIPMPGEMNSVQIPQNNYNNNSLSNQINSLEQRVRRLESIVNGSNYSSNYNSTNYQMM